MAVSSTKKIWAWYFYDWAAQPISTVIMTFIFAPYFTEIMVDGTKAQSSWGWAVGIAGILTALSAPILGAMTDQCGRRIPVMWASSILYVVGVAGLWFSNPNDFSVLFILTSLVIGLLGMEIGLVITNGMIPAVAGERAVGRISGSGFAFGYIGGMILTIVMLAFFAEQASNGRTILGLEPPFGLDSSAREGTRMAGPFAALWYIIFVIPLFLWLKDDPNHRGRASVGKAIGSLVASFRQLQHRKSLMFFLLSSMFARDALNGLYFFGGIYAVGVLGWTAVDMGIFGIIAITSGIVFTWIGGFLDVKYGPFRVICAALVILTAVVFIMVSVSRQSVLFIPVDAQSTLPDVAFYVIGCIVGAGGGILQAVSRTMVIKQSEPEEVTQNFGLYALTGRATAFLAPFSIAFVTDISGSQTIGILPLAILFALGLWLMRYVRAVE